MIVDQPRSHVAPEPAFAHVFACKHMRLCQGEYGRVGARSVDNGIDVSQTYQYMCCYGGSSIPQCSRCVFRILSWVHGSRELTSLLLVGLMK